jgi:hypothetical protein
MRGAALRTTVCSDYRWWFYGGFRGGFVIPASLLWFPTRFALFMFDLFRFASILTYLVVVSGGARTMAQGVQNFN